MSDTFQKKYKALILDLDGTTVKLGFENYPSEKVCSAIKKLSENVPVCIVTGRPAVYTLPIFNFLGLKSPCITNNGAVVLSPDGQTVLKKHAIDTERVRSILKIFSQKRDEIEIQTLFQEVTLAEYNGKDEVTGFFIKNLTEKQALHYQDLLQKNVENLSINVVLKATYSGNPLIYITDIHATKQQALFHLFDLIKVKPEDMVAVGDSENDLPMIIAAGMGVAMGNAAEGIKSVADWIAPSVDEDGVSAVIEKFF